MFECKIDYKLIIHACQENSKGARRKFCHRVKSVGRMCGLFGLRPSNTESDRVDVRGLGLRAWCFIHVSRPRMYVGVEGLIKEFVFGHGYLNIIKLAISSCVGLSVI